MMKGDWKKYLDVDDPDELIEDRKPTKFKENKSERSNRKKTKRHRAVEELPDSLGSRRW